MINIDPIITSVATSFVTSLATKGINGPAQTLDDIWELTFGGFHTYVEKKRAIRTQNLSDFKNKLVTNINHIPKENIQEPPLNIVGPALEASKYYIEEKQIRNMFAKLVASSMDNRKTNEIHSSYTEVIKQLSPLDAQNLIILKIKCPVVEYRLTNNDNNEYNVCKTNVFLDNPQNTSIDSNAISLSNLSRLGLIEISYVEHLTASNAYDKFEQTDYYKKLKQAADTDKTTFEQLSRLSEEGKNKIPNFNDFINSLSHNKVICTKGLAKSTPYGNSFINICC